MKQMWEERYGRDEYAYGEEPNAFFKACLDRPPIPGRLLLPGEGEGRNAVYAARQGWEVHAFDFSVAGREKAMRLADRYGVKIDYEVADYETADIEPDVYDAVAGVEACMKPGLLPPEPNVRASFPRVFCGFMIPNSAP